MKKVLLTLLAIVVTLGVLAGAGFVGYRIGNNRRALTPSNGIPQVFNKQQDGFGKQGFGPQGMPMQNFGRGNKRGFNREMGPGGFGMMGRGRGFGFFGPIQSLLHIAVLVFVIWLIYALFKASGWKLALTRQPAPTVKTESQDTESK